MSELSMWATVVESDYDGELRWDCHTEGDMGDGDSLPLLELAANTFPAGTRLEITEPAEPAEPAETPDPHPLASYPDGLTPGLYAIHWKTGGRSLAAIGMKEDGSRWIAPVNWVVPSTQSYGDTWEHIEMAVPIVEDREARPSTPTVGEKTP